MSPTERTGKKIVSFVLAIALWWVLTGGGGWWFGLPLAALVAFTSGRPTGKGSVRPMALPGFILFFLKESVVSGLDVSRRVLGRKMDITPALIDFPFTLPDGRSRVFFINVTNLLPGTMGVDIIDDLLKVHVLDRGANPEGKLLELEERVGRLFSVDLAREG